MSSTWYFAEHLHAVLACKLPMPLVVRYVLQHPLPNWLHDRWPRVWGFLLIAHMIEACKYKKCSRQSEGLIFCMAEQFIAEGQDVSEESFLAACAASENMLIDHASLRSAWAELKWAAVREVMSSPEPLYPRLQKRLGLIK